MENEEESDHFLKILENLEILEISRDFSSEKTPFVMTPFSGPELRQTTKIKSDVLETPVIVMPGDHEQHWFSCVLAGTVNQAAVDFYTQLLKQLR